MLDSRFGRLSLREAKPSGRVWVHFGAAIVVFGAISAVRGPSWDETFWLVMARRIAAGEVPYLDLLDNKGPLLYVQAVLFDRLPLSVTATLAVQFSFALGLLAIMTFRLARQSGQCEVTAKRTTTVVALTSAVLSTFSVTTELLSCAALVTALAANKPWARVAIALAAPLFDSRAAVFIPLVLWHGRATGRVRPVHAWAALGVSAAAIATVFAVPALHRSFVDLSFATRGFEGRSIADAALLGTLVVVPALLTVRWDGPRLFFVMAWVSLSAVLALSSGYAFGHYWIYAGCSPALSRASDLPHAEAIRAFVVALSTCTLVVALLPTVLRDIDLNRSLSSTLTFVADHATDEDRVVVWSEYPHLRLPIAASTIERAPTSNYLGWPLSDQREVIDDWVSRLGGTTMIVVEASRDPSSIQPSYHAALDALEARLADAECSLTNGIVTLYRFGRCDWSGGRLSTLAG